MMTRRSEVKVSESQMLCITRKDANVLKLPVKAIGVWVVVKESVSEVRLRKVRQDRYLASDKGNNFQVVSQKQFEVIKRNNDILKFQNVFAGISKRKREWVKMILKLFNDSKELKPIMKKFGKYNIAKQILFDTDATKTPVYNSTKTALSYWKNKRLENYEPTCE